VNAARLIIEGCAVATVDPGGSDYGSGHVADEGEISREIAAASRRLVERAEEVAQ
jgi:hypothetical protein